MARGEVLQIVVFSFLFGTACAAIPAKSRAVVDFCQALSDVMFRYTNYVMLFAPLGVFGAMAATIGDKGLGVLLNLGKLVLTLYATQMFFIVVVLGTVTAIARIPLRRFIRWVREPFLIAFSTASSEAALPLALENMQSFGVPKHIAAFVLPTGYSFNLDGSTLYLSLASMFVAQAAGIHLSLGTQITMMLTLMLTSKGVAAVPRASLVILAGTLASFNLPIEGVALLLGVDALMDMARTSVNLLGQLPGDRGGRTVGGNRVPRHRSRARGGDYSSLKLISIVTATSTGWPSFVPGVNSHWLTAPTAFASRPGSSDWVT